MARLTLNNNMTLGVRAVFIYPIGNWDPNDNLLSTGETISTGSSRTFEVSDGTYDVRIKLTDGTSYQNTNFALIGDVSSEIDAEFDLIDDDLD